MGDSGFSSRAGQVQNGLIPLRHFFKRVLGLKPFLTQSSTEKIVIVRHILNHETESDW